MFTIDGTAWEIPCDIVRKADVRASDISGMLLDRTMFYDILGTYMSYQLTLTPNPRKMGDYYTLYQLITKPVDGHVFTFPYNGETIEVTGKIDDIEDIYVRLPGGGAYWKGLSFTVTANTPTRSTSLSRSITRGLTPLPDVEEPVVGDTYTYTANGWKAVN